MKPPRLGRQGLTTLATLALGLIGLTGRSQAQTPVFIDNFNTAQQGKSYFDPDHPETDVFKGWVASRFGFNAFGMTIKETNWGARSGGSVQFSAPGVGLAGGSLTQTIPATSGALACTGELYFTAGIPAGKTCAGLALLDDNGNGCAILDARRAGNDAYYYGTVQGGKLDKVVFTPASGDSSQPLGHWVAFTFGRSAVGDYTFKVLTDPGTGLHFTDKTITSFTKFVLLAPAELNGVNNDLSNVAVVFSGIRLTSGAQP